VESPELTTAIEGLSDAELEPLKRETDLGKNNFGPSVEKLWRIRGLLELFAGEEEDELPQGLVSNVVAQANQIQELKERMAAFSWEMADAQGEKNAIDEAVEGIRNWFASELKPHLRGREIDIAARAAEIDAANKKIQDTVTEANAILTRIRKQAGEAGAGEMSSYYGTQATDYAWRARLFLFFTGAAVVALLVLGWYVFIQNPLELDQGNSADGWQTFVRDLVVRLFFLGTAGYVLAFAARNYRVSKHLQVANEEKRNAVNTYVLFTEAVTPEAQNIVTAELVRAVFEPTATGFLSAERERTIIESQPSILGVVRQNPPASS
jgi:hypothetical protein